MGEKFRSRSLPVAHFVFYATAWYATSMTIQITRRKIYCMDAMDFLDACKASGIVADAIITDPPYKIANNTVITRKDTTDIDLRFGAWDLFPDDESFFEWTFRWIDKCDIVLRPGGMLISFFDINKINFLSRYITGTRHYKFKNNFALVKRNPAPQFRGAKWQNGWEIAGMWQKPSGKDENDVHEYKDLTFNKHLGQHPDYFICNVISGKEREEATVTVKGKDGKPALDEKGRVKKIRHPTQKPVGAIRLMLRYWTNPGDTVIDPFAGVGTTTVACEMELDRKWVANDASKRWTWIAKKRVKKYTSQQRIDSFVNDIEKIKP
jgi:DNA modification methylase